MLTLLTTTGARPEAFALCQRWMMQQTFAGAVHWIIVDDGQEMTEITFDRENWVVTLVRPDVLWAPGMNTQANNLRAGLACVMPEDTLVIIEDDDYYSPNWLATVAATFSVMNVSLIGEDRARYYNVSTKRYRQLSNTEHASLCSTALRGEALAIFRTLCDPRCKFIDIDLWCNVPADDKFLFPGRDVVGIKGLPGRPGIGMGHGVAFDGIFDQRNNRLREWLGQDAEAYL